MSAPATSPPRLLAINNYFYRRGGAEAVFFDHMDLFERVGWDVVPFAMQHAENQASPWSPFFVSELEYGRTSGILAKANQAAKVIFSFEARRKIGELIRRAPPSIAHAHNVYHHLSPSIFGALKAANVPVVMTVHDLKLACPAYKMLTHGRVCEACHGGRIHNVIRNRCVKDSALLSGLVFLETLVHRTLGLYRDTLAKLITPSRFYRDKLVAWGWNPAQIAHVPNCIDTSRFVPAASIGNYFVYAGRLAPEKGLATLVRAAAMSNQRVVLAGSSACAAFRGSRAASKRMSRLSPRASRSAAGTSRFSAAADTCRKTARGCGTASRSRRSGHPAPRSSRRSSIPRSGSSSWRDVHPTSCISTR